MLLNLATSTTFGAYSVRNGTTCVDDALREAGHWRRTIAGYRHQLADARDAQAAADCRALLARARREAAQALLDARIHRYRAIDLP